MSGKYFNDAGKGSIWANEWNKGPAQQAESVLEVQSRTSAAATVGEPDTTRIANVQERMKTLFETQSYTDVTFYPSVTRNQYISAHRAFLAIGSPLFAKMLFGDGKKDTAGMKMEVQISNLSFDVFTNIVKYLYTDEVSLEDEGLVHGILEGAKQFGIHSLVSKCKQYFEGIELTEENVCSKLQMSIASKSETMKERCIDFIQRNTLRVVYSSDFLKCSSTTIRAICRLQSFNLRSEMEVLEAVMLWLGAQPRQNRKMLLEPLLKCIRILNFTVGELGDTLKRYTDIMTPEEGLSIMLFLCNPPKNLDFSSLPPWVNKNTSGRCFIKEGVHAAQNALNKGDQRGALVGKVVFPLKPDPRQGFVKELTSLLQMKCISGYHIIKAVTLTFERPMSDRCRIGNLFIHVHVYPSDFSTVESIQIAKSETVRVEFKRMIKVRRGDLLDIEAEAKDIELYKFLQFDEAGPLPHNPHFTSSVSSTPKQGKLYFISEVEYGPQNLHFNKKYRPGGHK